MSHKQLLNDSPREWGGIMTVVLHPTDGMTNEPLPKKEQTHSDIEKYTECD